MASDLERGREGYARHAWAAAHAALSRADEQSPLGGQDLERLALAAYLIGRDDDYLALLQRAYREHLAAGAAASAARTAFWLGLRLLFRGETGQANGWLARAKRLVENEQGECVEQGYLLLAVTQLNMGAGDLAGAYCSALNAVRIGERFGELDLSAVARHLLGLVRLQQGDVRDGLALLDEAMLAAAGGELSPLVTGLLYCSVIDGCREVYALGRMQEWTRALAGWCDEQPEMVAFVGLCSVHRAEMLQLHGAWSAALAEAQRAVVRCRAVNRRASGAAHYQEAEVHRLRGELDAAEQAYQNASQSGWDPQPGLALLRLAQARNDVAAASIRSALATARDRSARARLLPAYAEIMLVSGSVEEAESAGRELDEIAELFDAAALRAHAAQARGAVQLAQGDALGAVGLLRRAFQIWQELELPYCAARVRLLLAHCCAALHDEDGRRLELEASRQALSELGALADLAQLEASREPSRTSAPQLLTAREREVLRRVAAGDTNKAIASALSLSEKTVERHLSNIFVKLDVSTRTAAAAFAFEHHLL